MHSVHPVFHVSMLKPAISNTFSERIQLAPTPVIIDRKPKYEISWIVDSKIDCQQACKLLYKVIWLGYEDTGYEFKWIPVSELTHAANLVSDFHIAYPPSLVLPHCSDHAVVFVPCLHAFPMGIFFINFLVYSVCFTFGGFFSKLSNFFSF